MSILELTEAGPVTLPLADIRQDPDLQTRARVSAQVVREYSEAMREGAIFPPVVVFKEMKSGKPIYWLADGFQRCAAKALLSDDGTGEITVDIRDGHRKDALLFSAGCNANHGVRRSQACRRRAVELLLREPAWAKRADNWLATKAAVSPHLVAKVRSTFANSK